MKLSEYAAKKPVTTAVIYIALIVLGVFSLGKLAIDLIPDISFPVISIYSTWSGASPEEVEENLTKVLESAAAQVSRVKKITSTSREGQAEVRVEYEWGTNMGEASVDLREKLDLVRDFLPDDASQPVVLKFDPSQIPVTILTVEGNRDMKSLRYISENEIKRSFEQIDGVARVMMWGGKESQVHIDLDRTLLASFDITMDQIIGAMKAEHLNIAGGSIDEARKNFSLRTVGKFRSVEDVKDVVVGMSGGVPAYLKDVANVYEGYVDEEAEVKRGWNDTVLMLIQKQSGTNTVQIAKRVERKMAELQRSLPPDIRIVKFFTSADFIKQSITDVWQTAWMGGILAIVVIFIFLRNLPTTLIISVSIPLSVIVTFIFMYFFKLTVNMISLGGLALGIGMLVDNSIVVLENVFRYREYGVKPLEAAKLGSSEMFTAISASTLTTVAVFLPLAFFVKGLASELFSDLAFTVTFSLLASLVVAMTVVPMLTAQIKRVKVRGDLTSLLDVDKELSTRKGINGWLDRNYKQVIAWSLKHRVLVVALISLLFLGSIPLVRGLGVEFLPQSDSSFINATLQTPVGSSLAVTRDAVFKINQYIEKNIPERDIVSYAIGRQGEEQGFLAPNTAQIWMTLVSINKRKRTDLEVADDLRRFTAGLPGVTARFETGGGGGGDSGNLEIAVKGYDLKEGKDLAEKMKSVMENIDNVKDVRISREEGNPEYRIVLDKDIASYFGLSVAQIGQSIKRAFAGETVAAMELKGEEVDIFLRLREDQRRSWRDLELITLAAPTGVHVPLSNLVRIEKQFGPVNIQREKQERVVYLNARVSGDIKGAVDRIQAGARQIAVPPGFTILYGGSWQDLQETLRDLILTFGLSIILVYLIMAAQFESFVDPFIIMFTLPLTFIGVVWVHILWGMNFSTYSGMGVIVLAGVVVNNGIILVDYTNLLRKRGFGLVEAAALAGRARLRPVLMTSLTTVLGLVPMALALGEGAELRAPMARTIIGGLFVSTMFTLVFIPVLYTMFENRRIRRRERRAVRKARGSAISGPPVAGGRSAETGEDRRDRRALEVEQWAR
jgi:HAE1 family hydrophobic/amphiphilic exporter-1